MIRDVGGAITGEIEQPGEFFEPPGIVQHAMIEGSREAARCASSNSMTTSAGRRRAIMASSSRAATRSRANGRSPATGLERSHGPRPQRRASVERRVTEKIELWIGSLQQQRQVAGSPRASAMNRSLSGPIRRTMPMPNLAHRGGGAARNAVEPGEAVGGEGDHQGVEAAPALVAAEQLRVAEVEAEARALDQHLGQSGGIAEAEIEPLTRDRECRGRRR